jgi:hypothetical protein
MLSVMVILVPELAHAYLPFCNVVVAGLDEEPLCAGAAGWAVACLGSKSIAPFALR